MQANGLDPERWSSRNLGQRSGRSPNSAGSMTSPLQCGLPGVDGVHGLARPDVDLPESRRPGCQHRTSHQQRIVPSTKGLAMPATADQPSERNSVHRVQSCSINRAGGRSRRVLRGRCLAPPHGSDCIEEFVGRGHAFAGELEARAQDIHTGAGPGCAARSNPHVRVATRVQATSTRKSIPVDGGCVPAEVQQSSSGPNHCSVSSSSRASGSVETSTRRPAILVHVSRGCWGRGWSARRAASVPAPPRAGAPPDPAPARPRPPPDRMRSDGDRHGPEREWRLSCSSSSRTDSSAEDRSSRNRLSSSRRGAVPPSATARVEGPGSAAPGFDLVAPGIESPMARDWSGSCSWCVPVAVNHRTPKSLRSTKREQQEEAQERSA